MNSLSNWIQGDLSTQERIFSALAPAILLLAASLFAGIAYSIRVHFVGHFRDKELAQRETGAMVGRWMRLSFAWLIQPFWRAMLATQLPPAAITMLSLMVSGGAGVALAAGRFGLGGWLFLAAGILDIFDGRMARAMGTAGPKGAALDSILDRYADAAVLMGLCWYYRDSWILIACLFALVGSAIVPYVRAKGESLGIVLDGGLLPRPARVVFLGFSVALSPVLAAIRDPANPHPAHWLAVAGILLVGLGANITAILRMRDLFNFLDSPKKKKRKSKNKKKLAAKGGAFRSSVSALLATGSDAFFVLFFVSASVMSPGFATLAGCAVGAFVNFCINRVWAFDGRQGKKKTQAARYSVVWTISALLNASGVGLLLMLPSVDYRVAWVVVRAAVFFGWNHPLQRDYVFVAIKKKAVFSFFLIVIAISAAAPGWAKLSPTLHSASSVTRPASPLKPHLLSPEAYTETWTTIADLNDGTYVQLQLGVSNAGVGTHRGKCRILVIQPGQEIFTASKKIKKKNWRYEEPYLYMGPCYAAQKKNSYEVFAKIKNSTVRLVLDKKLTPRIPPGGEIIKEKNIYVSTVLVPWANVSADIDIEGRKKQFKLSGRAYADHSRTTTMPADLALRWARLRLLHGPRPQLALVRFPRDESPVQGWTWNANQSAPQALSAAAVSRAGNEDWLVHFDGIAADLSQRRLIYRYAPIEEMGFFGKIVRSVVGNPVTYTYRVPNGLLEVTEVNEH